MKKKLVLKRETLAELHSDDLEAVVGGGNSASCPITYTCGCTATGSIACTGVSNGCTNVTSAILAGGGC